ncbi:MAG: DUF3810 domain-containing protein [Clostridiales bacterium]|nr:DUF3810 domain-containing protein [Clostridiales bacterium]
MILLLLRLLCTDKSLVNWVIDNVTTPVKHSFARLCSCLPFSMAELVWAAAVVGILSFTLRSLWVVGKSLIHRLRGRRTHPLRRLLRRGLAMLSAGLFIYSGYTLTWGINYYGDTFSEMSGLEGREITVSELYDLACLFAEYCNDLSDGVLRDDEGVYVGDSETLFQRSSGLYEVLYDEFPCLDLEEAQAKPMFFSRLMSWLGFTGFYFPFTGESMVNVDAPAALVPATILHELAHQRNVAQESECNFLAIVVGLSSNDAEFQYSAALMGYIHVGNALYSADRELWREVRATVNEQVLADLTFNNNYWAQFESPASEAAEAVYSSFASSYGQEDIMKSYGACVDLLAAYYLP